jgi:hypothetical protein
MDSDKRSAQSRTACSGEMGARNFSFKRPDEFDHESNGVNPLGVLKHAGRRRLFLRVNPMMPSATLINPLGEERRRASERRGMRQKRTFVKPAVWLQRLLCGDDQCAEYVLTTLIFI